MICPCCRSQAVSGLYLVPLSFSDLERSIELRKSCAKAAAKTSATQLGKHPRDDEHEVYAESSYLLLSHHRGSLSGTGLSDREQQRTGRWTDEEIAFVDYLVSAFDQGILPLPHGIKLNEFLGDMLLCKSSRLTKKMKNAKLSTRSFSLLSPSEHSIAPNCGVLSNLQEKFLQSIQSEPTQLELRFNMAKQWRTHFSNLCLQVGYSNLEGTDWIASLEEMERRASNAEEIIRKVRRRRMGLALRTDGGSTANPSVYIGGAPADTAQHQLQEVTSSDIPLSHGNGMPKANPMLAATKSPLVSGRASDLDVDDDFMMASMMELGPSTGQGGAGPRFAANEEIRRRPRTFSEDFDAVLNDLMEPSGPAPIPAETDSIRVPSPGFNTCGPFLDAIVHHLENKKLPFQHVDVWVPSFMPREGTAGQPAPAINTDQLRLFHAGFATRGDLNEEFGFKWNEFGVYSARFSFEPGHGLPGRVYSSGTPAWENGIDEQDPKIFERAGGAKVYGAKTAVGIPLNTALVGRIIICMYSSHAVSEDPSIIRNCVAELSRYSPEPKWKLVIEMSNYPSGSNTKDKYTATAINAPSTGRNPLAAAVPLSGPTAGVVPPSTTTPQVDDIEQRIISLLGDNMPVSDELPAGESTSSSISTAKLLPHFMSIRLLLLRPSHRRTSEENDMIDILKKSFRAYANDNKRTGAELATLVAKDWICLKASYQGSNAMGSMPPPTAAPAPVAPSAGSNPTMASSGQFAKGSPPAPSSGVHQSYAMKPMLAPMSSFAGPMTPQPSQFPVAPSSTLGMFGGGMDPMGATKRPSATGGATASGMSPPPVSIRRGASFGAPPYRSGSFDSTNGNRSQQGTFDETNRATPPQPHLVKSSSGTTTPENSQQTAITAKPNVVLES